MSKKSRKDARVRSKVSEAVACCHDSSSDISDLSFPENLLAELIVVCDLSIREQKNTSIYHALVVMILCKIANPKQDIRKCQACMRGGFSARTFEQKYVLESLTERGLALRSDSAWLTRSLLREAPYNRNYKANFNGGEKLRDAFLKVTDSIQNQPERNHEILRFLFNKVTTHRKEKEVSIERPNDINSGRILNFIEEQIFFDYKCKGGARFCEIVCLSMMKTVAPQVKKYKDCQFGSLNCPCACDKSSKSSGDIEMYDNGRLVLSIETKLNVSVDPMVVMRAEKKIEKYAPSEYWIVSYSKNDASCDLDSMCERIYDRCGCRVSILDGIDWLRHLLCLLEDPSEFIKEYLDSIEKDEYLMKIHKDKTNELVLKYFGLESESESFKCA